MIEIKPALFASHPPLPPTTTVMPLTLSTQAAFISLTLCSRVCPTSAQPGSKLELKKKDRSICTLGRMEESDKMQRILHMKGGLGEKSYANNSKPQRACLSSAVPVLVQATLDFCDTFSTERVNVADMGCSSGPNTLFAVNEMIGTIHRRYLELGLSTPEFCVFLNDLPGNDFNTVFQSLPAFHEKMRKVKGPDLGPCYISAVPGSFHSRLFPQNSLHLVHSSSSLHWLSQVPPELSDRSNPAINKGKIFVSKTSPPAVISAYRTQFQRDFSSFLKARSIEVVPGGRMVLVFNARRVEDPTPDESCLLWDYLGQAFQDLVSQGLIEEEKLDSYNTPYYEPYTEDIEDEIEKEGSFTVDELVSIILPWDVCNGGIQCDRRTTAENMGKAMRAINGSMIGSSFGEQILDPLFQRFSEIMAADQKEVEHFSVVVSVIRNIQG